MGIAEKGLIRHSHRLSSPLNVRFSYRRHALKYTVAIDPTALADIRKLRAYDRTAIFDSIERILRTGPTNISKSRIKRLRDFDSPQYRLRIGDFRVFYNVGGSNVYVMRVLAKDEVDGYLREVRHEIEKRQRGTTGSGNGEDR